jgi:hypothetical protein
MTSGILFNEPERDQTVSPPFMRTTASATHKSDLSETLNVPLRAQRCSTSTSVDGSRQGSAAA